MSVEMEKKNQRFKEWKQETMQLRSRIREEAKTTLRFLSGQLDGWQCISKKIEKED